jgi:siroheme synthase-like protein
MTPFYPAFLDLRGRLCAVIGGGPMAEGKVLGLLAAGARVIVIDPQVTPRLDEIAAQGRIELLRRPYRWGDLEGVWLAISAPDDRSVNRQVWEEAQHRRVWLNAVDDLPHCGFIAPAIHRHGDLTVAISTAGKAPALAVRLRERIAASLGREYGAFLDLLGGLRAEIADRVPDFRARTALWYRIVDSDALDLVRRGEAEAARRRIDALVREAAES